MYRLTCLLLALCASGCQLTMTNDADDLEGAEREKSEVLWVEGARGFDPLCTTDCVELAEGHMHHLGGVTLQVDWAVDDAVAQWADCVGSVIACRDSGATTSHCVEEAAACPSACWDFYQGALPDPATAEAALDTFEAVFITDEAPCLPGGAS